MFCILSALFIAFLYDSNLSNKLLKTPESQADYYKILIRFGALQLLLLIINNTFNYFIFKFLPNSSLPISIIITALIVLGVFFLIKMILEKFKVLKHLYFNSNSIIYMLIVNCVLLLSFSSNYISTLLTTILNGIGFLIVGVIIISILNCLKDNKKPFGELPIILIVSSIILLLLTVI